VTDQAGLRAPVHADVRPTHEEQEPLLARITHLSMD
jgi:hypothetical protein